MYSQAFSKKAKFFGGAPDFQKPEGSVWEEFENARKAISHDRAAQLPECAPRALRQSLTLKRRCCTCGYHLKIPVNFVSEFVFYKWDLLGWWRMCGQLRASPCLWSCLPAFLNMTSATFCPWPPPHSPTAQQLLLSPGWDDQGPTLEIVGKIRFLWGTGLALP